MTLTYWQLGVLVFGWIAYFLIHSLLASLWLKERVYRRYPGLRRYYRVLYNGVAVVALFPLLALLYLWRTSPLWDWPGGWFWLANGIAVIALAGFFWTLKYYDGSDFLGLQGLMVGRSDGENPPGLVFSPIHRFVRHPWYFLALILIWTRDIDEAWLISALLMTGYFFAGSYLEERKLIQEYGQQYRLYLERVPGLIPLPWRYLSEEDLAQLLRTGVDENQSPKKPKK